MWDLRYKSEQGGEICSRDSSVLLVQTAMVRVQSTSEPLAQTGPRKHGQGRVSCCYYDVHAVITNLGDSV